MPHPVIPVVPLRQAAEILGLTVRAAESALRHHGIKSGYPLAAVEWLRDNRPGRGSRTDLKEQTMTSPHHDDAREDLYQQARAALYAAGIEMDGYAHDTPAGQKWVERKVMIHAGALVPASGGLRHAVTVEPYGPGKSQVGVDRIRQALAAQGLGLRHLDGLRHEVVHAEEPHNA